MNKRLKYYFKLCNDLKIEDYHRKIMLSSYNVESSKNLSESQLEDIIQKLEDRLKKADTEEYKAMDIARKRLIASVFAWLGMTGVKHNSINKVKAVCCRAAKVNSFNQIEKKDLARLYGEFTTKQETFRKTQKLSDDEQSLIKES